MADLLPSSPRQRVALVVALLFLAGAAGYFIGARRDDPPAEDSVDAGFLFDMITHHEQALDLAQLELGSGSVPSVNRHAREILQFQAYEIGLMERHLAEWGYRVDERPEQAMAWMGDPVAVAEMPGLATGAELDALANAEGRDRDALFLALMADHHRGGVEMAEHAAEHADDEFVRRLAETVARNQRIEINELEQTREREGLDSSPPGHEPDEAEHETDDAEHETH